MHNINIMFRSRPPKEMRDGRRCEGNQGWCCILFEKKCVKCFVQYHVFAQSPPGRHPNDKYPVPICIKMFHSQYCLVGTVIHIKSTQSATCIYTYILHNTEKLVGQKT